MSYLESALEKFGYGTVTADLFDCGDVAEIRLHLFSFDQPYVFTSFTNVELPENKSSLDVFNSYKEKGHFDFEKFINDQGPLKFVVRGYLGASEQDIELLEYTNKFIHEHLCNQEDFVSSFTEDENKLIQDRLLRTYKNIVHLGELGFDSKLIADYLGEDVELDCGVIDSSEILAPLLKINFSTEKIAVDPFHLFLTDDPSLVKINCEVRSLEDVENQTGLSRYMVDAALLVRVDHTDQTFEIEEACFSNVYVEEFYRDSEEYFPVKLDEFLESHSDSKEFYNRSMMNEKLTEMLRSPAMANELSDRIFY